jgi:hypothetical protein
VADRGLGHLLVEKPEGLAFVALKLRLARDLEGDVVGKGRREPAA